MSPLVFCIHLHNLCIQLTHLWGKETLISYYDMMAESQNGGAAGGSRCWAAESKYISAATAQHTIEELLEAVLLFGTCQGCITRTSGRSWSEVGDKSQSSVASKQWQFVAGCEESPLLAATT
jgi:hypothetical protein